MNKKGAGAMDFGNIGGLFKQVQDMQKKMVDMDIKMAKTEFSGIAGGGEGCEEDSACEAVGNGKYKISGLSIGRRFVSILGEDEAALLCDLLIAMFNDYSKKVSRGSGNNMADAVSDMKLPMDLLGDAGSLLGLDGEDD